MSIRAVKAYENDKMPISKWTKSAVLRRFEDCFEEEQVRVLSKFSAKVLKSVVLERKEWHHTSKFFNETNFYGIADDYDIDCFNEECKRETFEDLLAALEEADRKAKASPELKSANTPIDKCPIHRAQWEEWAARSKRWGRWVQYAAYGRVRDGKFYFLDASGKLTGKFKRISGSHFQLMEKVSLRTVRTKKAEVTK
jgi:hypothetical protein